MYVFVVDRPGVGKRACLSPLPPEEAHANGLRSEAIIGELADPGDPIDATHVQVNPLFVQFLHWVLARHAAQSPELQRVAARQQQGYIYIIDQRTPSADGAVPPEDIVGAVELEAGRAVRYLGSPSYRVVTDRGPLQLGPWLRDRLVDELRALGRA